MYTNHVWARPRASLSSRRMVIVFATKIASSEATLEEIILEWFQYRDKYCVIDPGNTTASALLQKYVVSVRLIELLSHAYGSLYQQLGQLHCPGYVQFCDQLPPAFLGMCPVSISSVFWSLTHDPVSGATITPSTHWAACSSHRQVKFVIPRILQRNTKIGNVA